MKEESLLLLSDLQKLINQVVLIDYTIIILAGEMMEWNFNNETPIYLQIIDRFKMDIANGSLKPGNKVPSVRELALSAGVNPNTMQKALSELERDGYLESRRTSGRFVADMGNQADSLKNDLAHKLCSEFCEGMSKVGFTPEQSLTVYENYLKSLKKE